MALPKAKLIDLWLVQPFQHHRLDRCESASAFATEAGAMEAAREWAEGLAADDRGIPYDAETEHEAVVFKAVASYRGRPVVAIKHDVAPMPVKKDTAPS